MAGGSAMTTKCGHRRGDEGSREAARAGKEHSAEDTRAKRGEGRSDHERDRGVDYIHQGWKC